MRAIDRSLAPRESLTLLGAPTRPVSYRSTPTAPQPRDPLHFAVAIATGPVLRIEFASAEFRQAFGGRPLIGRALAQAIRELADQGAMEGVRDVVSTAMPWVDGVVRVGPGIDGGNLPGLEACTYRLDVRPLFDRDGAVIGVMLLLREGGDRIIGANAAGVLAADALITNLPQIVYTTTPDGICDACNRSWYDYTGMRVERVGWQWLAYVHPSERERTARAWSDAVVSGAEVEIEFRLRRRDDAYRWFLSRARPIRDGDDRIVQWLGTCTDIEGMRSERRALMERNTRTTQFVAAAVHELRNGLAPIQHSVELLSRWTGDTATRAETSNAVARQVQHMARIVGDLQDASRMAHGLIEVRREDMDLRHVVTAAADAVRPATLANEQTLSVVVSPEPLPMRGDPDRLTQVLTNLLGNAAKFTDRGGTITLVVTRDEAGTEIQVCDTGIGIAPEMLERIFEPFARGAAANGGVRASGLGLGLPLAKRLVELHGGTLRASSRGPGQGSEFVVRLPAAREQGVRTEHATTMDELLGDDRPRCILIIDDNVESARAMGRLLRTLGYRVALAHDGPTGLAIAVEVLPDVALVDVALPKMSGYDVALRMRHLRRLQDTVLVAMSGHGGEEQRRRSLEAGFREHLVKPIDVDTLSALFADLWPEVDERHVISKVQ